MAHSQPFREDDIQRLADGAVARITKNAFRSRVPETNHPFSVGGNDRIGARG
jgi:hypothetical protein